LDITQPKQWEDIYQKAIEKFGGIDVHFNIAGYLSPGSFYNMSDSEVERHIDVNIKGTIHGTRAASNHMKPKRKGFILNIASMSALCPIPGLGIYAATKAAVRSFTLTAANELKPFNVKVTCLCPTGIRTPMVDIQASVKEASWTFSSRILEVEEIVDLILENALPNQPTDIWYPLSRGFLARFGDTFWGNPLLTFVANKTTQDGLHGQKEYISSTKRKD